MKKILFCGIFVLTFVFPLGGYELTYAQDNCVINTTFDQFPTEETYRSMQAAEELYYFLFREYEDEGGYVWPPEWDSDNRCCYGSCTYGDGIHAQICREGETIWPGCSSPDMGTYATWGVFGGGCAYWNVECDTDFDGIADGEDNCPETPNGPDGGTCIAGDKVGDTCINNNYCGTYGFCSKNQEDSDGNGIGDVCDVPHITIISPKAGDDWWIGSTYTIEWNSSGITGNVKIELGRLAGCWGYNWSTITSSTSNDGSYPWTVQGPVQNNCKIRICSIYNPDCCGGSEPFDIEGNRPPTKPTITFSKNPIEPGESFQFCAHSTDPEGDVITYHWEIIYPNDGVNNIDSVHECTSAILSIPGSYTFYCTAEDEYGAKSATAGAKLTVGTITVTSPATGEDWGINSSKTIRWSSLGVNGNVNIKLGRPSGCGTSWSTITSSTSNTGSYDWTVEGPAQNNCTIRITSVDIPEIYGESGSFDIVVYEGEPYIKEYSNSGCLDNFPVEANEYPGCGEDEVTAEVEGSNIHVTHFNATYNCCPDDIKVTLFIEGKNLKLIEEEILTTPCDCLCCYNIKTEIAGLMPGEYTLEVCWDDWETNGQLCKTVTVVVPN